MRWAPLLLLLACSRGADTGDGAPTPDTDSRVDTSSPGTDITPTPPDTGTSPRWTYVASGLFSNCAIREGGSVECWGGEIYLGPHVPRPGPYVQTIVGSMFACALRPDGAVDCWGCQDQFIG